MSREGINMSYNMIEYNTRSGAFVTKTVYIRQIIVWHIEQ